jgi:hypothetical protein
MTKPHPLDDPTMRDAKGRPLPWLRMILATEGDEA